MIRSFRFACWCWILLSVGSGVQCHADPPEEIVPTGDNLTITRSVRIKPGTYRIADADGNGIVHIQGDDLTVDFQGAVLDGASEKDEPDEYAGRGVVAEKCRNLTVKNLTVRGVKIGMYFKECDGLTVSGCDVSANWRMHLKSTPRAEDGADWLSAHENDDDQWLRYGAGIWVERAKNVTLSRNRARNGQNGICAVRLDDSWIIDNDLSFLSGWGLAMWRSCRNDVSNNKFDYCIRGFSYQVYHRGQDSAGILVYEQCHENVFAFNSATHGGDGFFLYAGNETLQRTGEGGCNRNLLYRNDFSHAAANGIEATFSDGNVFAENILEECDHGIWAGYSYNTIVAGNRIRRCHNGVSIEHGHDNTVTGNAFEANGLGVHFWGGPNEEFLKTAFGKKKDTTSHGGGIWFNTFAGDEVAIDLGATSGVHIARNEVKAGISLRCDAGCKDILVAQLPGRIEGPPPEQAKIDPPAFAATVPKTRGTQDAFLPAGTPRGWRTIFVDEWGPYDFSHPRLFPNPLTAAGKGEMFLIGPEGEFSVSGVPAGVEVAPTAGKMPVTLAISSREPGIRAFEFTVTAGKETIRAEVVLMRATWDVKVFAWKGQGPGKPPADWAAVVGGTPVDRFSAEQIDYKERPSEKSPDDFYATVATTELEIASGAYHLRTVSDDGVRVFVDDEKVIDHWTWHGPAQDEGLVSLAAGKHRIRVEHFEIDGYAQLSFSIEPVK